MRPGLVDRLLVIWLIAALLLWAACDLVLWGWAVGTSAPPGLMAAALFLAIAAVAPLPWYIARALQRVLILVGLLDVRAVEIAADGPTRPRDIRRAGRLLGTGAIFAVACAAASTVLIWPGRAAAQWVAQRTVLAPAAAMLADGVLVAAGLVPLALGLCVVVVLSAAVRGSGGRDAHAGAWRDAVLGAAIGAGAFAVLVRTGAN
ncbi:MAG: hypothetical protein ACOC8F_03570, partial [Planctomycetota bacterium]